MTDDSDTPSAADETKQPPTTRERFARKPDPDAATLADLRRRYDAGELSAAALARELGLSPTTIRKRLVEWGWTRGRPPRGDAGERALHADAARLRKTVMEKARRQIKRLETKLSAPDGEEDSERVARLLASLVKTLADLKRMDMSHGHADDDHRAKGADAAVDLARIKTELVDRLVAAAAAGPDEGHSDEP